MSIARFRSPLALGLAALLACGSATAGNLVDINIVDRSGQGTLPEYRHRGDTWVQGTPGHIYNVQLVNRSDRRVLVVLSVDGVNVITGDRANYGQSGYVLEPYQTAEIDGWRKSMQHSAQFYFTSVPDSYAGRTGRPDNVGVIGAAVFTEKYVPPVRIHAPAMAESRAAPPAPQMEMSKSTSDAAVQRIGTGHGETRYSAVSRTRFERASTRPDEVVAIRYDNRSRLVALGILPRRGTVNHQAPQPFPGFVPDPPR